MRRKKTQFQRSVRNLIDQYREGHYRRAPQERLINEMRDIKRVERMAARDKQKWNDMPGATTPHLGITDKGK